MISLGLNGNSFSTRKLYVSCFRKICQGLRKWKNSKIVSIRSDHGREFSNEKFESFYDKHGIKHNFSTPRTPQQNGVVERKNRSLK